VLRQGKIARHSRRIQPLCVATAASSIDEQARNVAPRLFFRLFLYLLKAGRAGDIDSGHAVADHTSNPASNSPRRCSTRPSAAAISRSRDDNGRATPFPPVARLPRTSRPWGMRARQKGTGLPPMMSTRLPPSTISGENFCTTTLRASWRSVGWVAGQADVLHPGAYFAAALPHDVLRFAHCQGVAMPLRCARHREYGVPVDPEAVQRAGNEEQFHGVSSGSATSRWVSSRNAVAKILLN